MGIKFCGCCLEIDSNGGFYSPDSGKTRMNFAVPSDQVIHNYTFFLIRNLDQAIVLIVS